MQNNRIYQLDLTRALCALWIVSFWHMQYYVPYAFRPQGAVEETCRTLTDAVLATFTFLSGFFLKKYSFRSVTDAGRFYVKRLLRFYPLYALSAVLMEAICGGTAAELVSSLLGYAIFTRTTLQTLWYINMLLVFYLLTPLLPQFHADRGRKGRLVLCSAVALLFYAASAPFADPRLLFFFPFYLLGLNTDMETLQRCSGWMAIAVALMAEVLLFALMPQVAATKVMETALGAYLLLAASLHAPEHCVTKQVSFIATGSMCAYLFHRQLYQLVLMAEQTWRHRQFMSLPVALCTLIVLMVLAYAIQRAYDAVIVRKGK